MSSGGPPPGPIRAEIKAPKVANAIDLETVLMSISQSTAHAAAHTGAEQPSAEVAEGLRKISQLAKELSNELGAIKKLEPAIEERIARVAPRAQHEFVQGDR